MVVRSGINLQQTCYTSSLKEETQACVLLGKRIAVT